MQFAPLIELSRAGLTECLHFGAIAVVNRHGKLLAQVGDPHWWTYTRSTLKALQALPFVYLFLQLKILKYLNLHLLSKQNHRIFQFHL